MSVNRFADDLSSAVHYALETTRAIAVCPFHLDVTIRIGDDAAVARARKLVKSDGTTWEGEVLRKEFGRQLSKAADRCCPYCTPLASDDDADVNPPRPAFDDDGKAMSWFQEETPFACEGLGDLVTLEKSKRRDDSREPRNGSLRRFKKQAKVARTS